jgi:hypothetical protein
MKTGVRKLIPLVVTVTCVLLSGCFTREDAFYEDSQVVQAPLQGAYRNIMELTGHSDGGASWFIAPSMDYPGKYEFTIQESDVTVVLLGTFFSVGTNLFLDLYPLRDSGVYRVGGTATVTEAIRGAMFKPLHVAWKVQLTGDGLDYWFPYGNGVMAALRQAPELKAEPAQPPARVFLPGSPKEAQKYLMKFKDDASVFNYKGRLVKHSEAQPNGAANRSQPIRSETNRPPAAAGSGR